RRRLSGAAQRGPQSLVLLRVVLPEDAELLELGNDMVDELLQAVRQDWCLDSETVDGASAEPVGHGRGDLLRGSDQVLVAAGRSECLLQLSQRVVTLRHKLLNLLV